MTTAEQPSTEQVALAIARGLVDAGIPVFAAPPDPASSTGYRLPSGWSTFTPDQRRVDVWRPGYALAAICGHGLDVVDWDPRNGPEAFPCAMPAVYGQATTPSGGLHLFIAPTGLHKGVIADGWDLQAGAADGTGRGFVFIAPTVRVSKMTGLPGPYVWREPPRVPPGPDGTAAGLVDRMLTRKATPGPSAPVGELGDPIPHGQHQDVLFRYACSLRARGVPEAEAAVLVDARAGACVPPWRGPDLPWDAVRHAYRAYEAGEPAQPEITFSGPPPGHVAAVPTSTAAERLGALDSRDLESIQPPTPLLAELLDVNTVAILAGKFGTYKTFVALAWAASIATGRAWGPFGVPTAGRVVYVAAEGASGVRGRLRAWEESAGVEVPRGALTIVPRSVRLDSAADVDALIELSRGAALVVLDTLHKMAPGAEEQSSKDMGVVLGHVERIRRETGATVLLIHHTGHAGERARGSSSIEDDVDSAFVIKLGGDGEDRKADNPRTIIHRKTKDGELATPRRLEFVKVGESAVVRPGVEETELTRNAVALNALWVALDAAGVPDVAGFPTASAMLRGRGVRFDDKLLKAVVANRKAATLADFYQRPEWAPPLDDAVPDPSAGTSWALG